MTKQRDHSFQEILYHVFMLFLDITELSPLQKLQSLIGDTCRYLNQKWGHFLNRTGKSML